MMQPVRLSCVDSSLALPGGYDQAGTRVEMSADDNIGEGSSLLIPLHSASAGRKVFAELFRVTGRSWKVIDILLGNTKKKIYGNSIEVLSIKREQQRHYRF